MNPVLGFNLEGRTKGGLVEDKYMVDPIENENGGDRLLVEVRGKKR